MSKLIELLVCPACRGSLDLGDGDIRCTECGRWFPRIGTIPCLFEDPEAIVSGWRAAAARFDRSVDDLVDGIVAQLAQPELLESTRERLDGMRVALLDNRDRVRALLASDGLAQSPEPGSGDPGVMLTDCYDHIHRDWGWGDEGGGENRAAFDAVSAILGTDEPLGTVLVLGGGACRLPYDLHQHHDVDITVVLDINPLPFLVAKRIVSGDPVELFEFPLHPAGLDGVAIDRRLEAPDGPARDFELVFADGLAPPVRPHSVDTLITPWFLDQIPRDAWDLMVTIGTLLRDGGRWINFGPLVYDQTKTRIARRYSKEEIMELVANAGFEVVQSTFEPMVYLQSPAGSQGRMELVLTFAARKTGPAKARPGATMELAWLEDTTLPVPRFEGIERYQPPHPMFAAVVALIDGTRSVADIARVLVERHRVPEAAAEGGVRACLGEIRRATAGGNGSGSGNGAG